MRMNPDLMEFTLEIVCLNNKGWKYVMLDAEAGTLFVASFISNNDAIYFDSFGIENVSKLIKKVIGNKTCKEICLEYKQVIQ